MLKKLGKILFSIFIFLILVAMGVYFFVLEYPNLTSNPKVDKMYQVTTSKMKDSEGGSYRAFFKKGKENKLLVYFAGGGVSINSEMAKDDTYNTKSVPVDYLANITMNMGGLASSIEKSPYKDWSIIMFPYATGDFHSGRGEFKYIDTDGKEKILYHNGYINYQETMNKIVKVSGIDNPDTVVVTGYSAGGFGAALLADDIFTNYFPHTVNKNVLIDASLLLHKDWKGIATNVWNTPETITNKMKTNNLTLDMLVALREKYGPEIKLLFDSSTRDGDLAKVQNYFDTGIMDVSEKEADIYQTILKETVAEFKKHDISSFIWDGVKWYDDPRNLTAHTIISTPLVWGPLESTKQSINQWLLDAINGQPKDYGLELLDKKYE
ncbi:pectin acetylesterase-family hydrolase [Aerococcus sp. L_32]|uniref:pectin acetylesterase-family hydrolase n=1 Tax=Aerococcus sp. L_32 TaxID=3422316 RepID=UPI003D6A442E